MKTKSRLKIEDARSKGSAKVAVAMSGGVDSGVAAALVVKAGYKAAGFHMHLWAEPASSGLRLASSFENKCCSTESLEAARKTAHQLRMPFYIVDLEKIFKKRVVDYFLKEYGLGRTPNPCVMCNRFIKFGELLHHAQKLGYDYLATGHYARVMEGARDAFLAHEEFAPSPDGEGLTSRFAQKGHFAPKPNLVDSPRSFRLLMGRDKIKDQSYFLYNLTQKQLTQVMFPVGNYEKKEVVAMAKKWKLPVAERPESQEICFFPETDYRPFLKRQIREKIIPGEVVDTKGKAIGRHKGIPLYTIGQRHGFEITNKKVIGPLYVVAKDAKKNRLVVGFGKEAERKEFWVKDVSWIDSLTAKRLPLTAKIRIRHQGELLGCRVSQHHSVRDRQGLGSRVKVILAEGERGIAPGQAAVFYQGKEVLGGGIIAIDRS